MEKNTEEFRRWLAATRDEPLEGMAAFFDARTGEYEAHMAPWAAQYQWMARELPGGTKRLLDLGCGTGLELDCIFRRLPNLEVTGVDLAGNMLDLLRRKHPGKALTLVQADYFAWEPEDAPFDAMVAFETLHHVSAAKKAELFAKVHRWLRPGGVFLECDYIAFTPEMEEMAFAEAAPPPGTGPGAGGCFCPLRHASHPGARAGCPAGGGIRRGGGAGLPAAG